METTTVIGIIVTIVLAAALILFLIRRNVKDEENIDPELTQAFMDSQKQNKSKEPESGE